MPGPGGSDFEELLRASRERMAKTGVVRERLRELTGNGESADGRIKVTCTAQDPLAELHIDARAMRLGSQELASEIRTAFRAAKTDLDRQVQQVTQEIYGDEGSPLDAVKDPAELRKSLNDMQEMFGSAGRQAQAVLDQLRGALGGDITPGRRPR